MTSLLVVDDMAIIRSTIAKIISRENLDIAPIIEAQNGEEAVQMARQHHPDIVFMDIKMPGMNGLQATSIIRKENPHSKIIMLTAYDEFSYVQEALKLGAVDYLLKPVRPNKLSRVISEIKALIHDEAEQQRVLDDTRHRLEKTLPIVELNLVDDLLYRQALDKGTIKNTLRQLNKTINMPIVMVVSIDKFNKAVKQLPLEKLLPRYDAMTSAIRQGAGDCKKLLLGAWQLGQMAIILSTDEMWSMVAAQKKLAETIKQVIFNQLHISVTIAIGSRYAGLEFIPTSYAEARTALRDHKNNDCVLHISDIKHGNIAQGYTYPLVLEKELLENIRLKQEDISLELMNEIIDNLLYNFKDSLQILYSYLAELHTLISRTVIELGAPAPQVFDLSHQQMALLFSAPSRAQLRAWAVNDLTDLMALIDLETTKPNKDSVQMAIEYIHKNHHNPEIALGEVAGSVGLSQSHLAYLLKERVGVSYSKYLSTLRVKHAKKLLRTTTMTISSISEAVGYPNPTNFYRIFQRETEMTPNSYRQLKKAHHES